MTAAQLRLLVILALELVTNAVQQLNVTLLRVLPECCYEGVRHGASGLSCNVGVRSVRYSLVTVRLVKDTAHALMVLCNAD